MLSSNLHILSIKRQYLNYNLGIYNGNKGKYLAITKPDKFVYGSNPLREYKPKDINVWKRKVKEYTPYVPQGRAMSFSVEDYLSSGKEKYSIGTIDPQHLNNAVNLINKVNELGELVNYNGKITSGYRSPERQRQIYAEKGEPPAMGSKHLSGHALDIYDPSGTLKSRLLNRKVLEKARDLGLYFENFGNTPTWVHIQDEAPGFTGGQIWSADDLLEKNNL